MLLIKENFCVAFEVLLIFVADDVNKLVYLYNSVFFSFLSNNQIYEDAHMKQTDILGFKSTAIAVHLIMVDFIKDELHLIIFLIHFDILLFYIYTIKNSLIVTF